MRLEYGSAAHPAISGLQEGGRSGMKDREVRISWWARGSPDTATSRSVRRKGVPSFVNALLPSSRRVRDKGNSCRSALLSPGPDRSGKAL